MAALVLWRHAGLRDRYGMNDTSLLLRLVVALAIGLLFGLERGWRQREEAEGERAAGLRTYTLTALLGALSALLSTYTSPVFLGLSFLVFALAFGAFAWLEAATVALARMVREHPAASSCWPVAFSYRAWSWPHAC